MEETLSKKDQDTEILRNTLKAKEEESCKLIKELNERCQLLQQEKGDCEFLYTVPSGIIHMS